MKSSELKINLPKERAVDLLFNLEIDNAIDKSFYNEMILRKKNKRKRIIHEPIEPLKVAQRSLLRFLYHSVEINKNLKYDESKPIFKGMKEGLIRGVTAYRPFSSVIRNAHFHNNQEMMIKLDINNFFGSVREKHIKNLWRKIWNRTQKNASVENQKYTAEEICKLTSNSVQLTALNDSLPQGAPTSGFLANCVLDEFDKILLTYCSKRNLNYSRYSDDITISGKSRKSKEISQIISFVSYQLKSYDFELHQRKTRILKKNNRQIVTGIVVNEKLSAPRKLKKALRQEVYYLFKFTESHVNRHHSNNQKYLNRLLGKINWVLQVEKNNFEFQTYRNQIKDVKSITDNQGFAIGLACREVLNKTEAFVAD